MIAKYPSPAGKYEGMYIDLDFAYLKDMSDIDYKVRLILFKMIINIEHSLKLKILNIIENINEEDGYNIVNLFLEDDFNNKDFPKKVHNSILKKVGNVYYEKIFSKYDIDNDKKLENIPVWEFLEIISFGELISFYNMLPKGMPMITDNGGVIHYPTENGFKTISFDTPKEIMVEFLQQIDDSILSGCATVGNNHYIQNRAETPSWIIHNELESNII